MIIYYHTDVLLLQKANLNLITMLPSYNENYLQAPLSPQTSSLIVKRYLNFVDNSIHVNKIYKRIKSLTKINFIQYRMVEVAFYFFIPPSHLRGFDSTEYLL